MNLISLTRVEQKLTSISPETLTGLEEGAGPGHSSDTSKSHLHRNILGTLSLPLVLQMMIFAERELVQK